MNEIQVQQDFWTASCIQLVMHDHFDTANLHQQGSDFFSGVSLRNCFGDKSWDICGTWRSLIRRSLIFRNTLGSRLHLWMFRSYFEQVVDQDSEDQDSEDHRPRPTIYTVRITASTMILIQDQNTLMRQVRSLPLARIMSCWGRARQVPHVSWPKTCFWFVRRWWIQDLKLQVDELKSSHRTDASHVNADHEEAGATLHCYVRHDLQFTETVLIVVKLVFVSLLHLNPGWFGFLTCYTAVWNGLCVFSFIVE